MSQQNRSRVTVVCTMCAVFLAVLFAKYPPAAAATYVGGTYSTNQTWTPDGSPYIVNSDVVITNCSTLTITTTRPGGGEAPVEIKFNPGKRMLIGTNTYPKQYGALIAQGTASCPITFTTNSPGSYWKGISFIWRPADGCSGLNNRLSHCIIEYGGETDTSSQSVNGRANVALASSDVRIEYCTIRNGRLDGIYINSGDTISCFGTVKNCVITSNPENGIKLNAASGSSVTGACFPTIQDSEISHNGTYGLYSNNGQCNPDIKAGNTFVQNGSYPLRIPALMRIAAANSFTGNSQQAIEVIGRNIFENKTWHNFGIPYIVRENNVTIPDASGRTYTLTIEPGTTIKFDSGRGLVLGNPSNNDRTGILNAQGTKDHPITFTSIVPGQYWTGISFNWSQSLASSVLNYCIVEYGGAHKSQYSSNLLDAAILFCGCYPQSSTITNSTIRYSVSDGIKFCNLTAGTATIHNCNLYGNALYDIKDTDLNSIIHAELNFWGSPNGPGQDFCSSAVVDTTVKYEAWLEEESTDPLRFTAASATPKQFNPLTGSTAISFTLSQPATWRLSVLNLQLEKVWSTSGSGLGGTITWNGVGDTGGVVSGLCFYRIEAESTSGTASPARGLLSIGNQAVARITQPVSGSLFSAGTDIVIAGTAQVGTGGYYEVKYGSGESPTSWTTICGPLYSSKQNEQLATWNTAALNQPAYTIKLDVNKGGTIYSDVVRIGFFAEEKPDSPDMVATYTYDALGRLTGVNYPDGSWITYAYDRVGNRVKVERAGKDLPTAITLSSFTATATMRGVLLEWKTETEIKTAGFNLYRKGVKEQDFQKINSSLIKAHGSETSGAQYSSTDIPPKAGSVWHYLLEEVETSGTAKQYGPVSTVNVAFKNMNGTGAFRKSFQTNCD
ncbi:MAG: hypothetical protein NTZ51_10970 [Proteobacteria bacterium]|nr:hypothetical protein [Pseudomonadota bacterium]